MTNTAKIRRQGGAAVLSIPPALLTLLGAGVGTELTLSVDNGSLIATPASAKKRYTLAQLLEGTDEMTELNRQAGAWQGGDRRGNETF